MSLQFSTTALSPDKLALLATVPLFKGISQETANRILTPTLVARLAKDDKLLVPGQATKYAYVILSGRLRVQLADTDTPPLALYGAGDSIGEMSILSGRHNASFVIAATDCELLAIELSSVWALLEESHQMALNLLHILSQRIEIDDQIASDSLERHNGYQGFDMVDSVTGLYNQHWIHKELGRYLKRCLVDNRFSCMMMLEIDGHREYIEKYGVLGGDQALRTFAHTIISCQRPEDQAGHYAGSKFIVFLPYTTAIESACIAAERLRVAISNAPIVLPSGDALPKITVSLGVCQLRDDGLPGLLARAEQALQEAQKNGGNCIRSIT